MEFLRELSGTNLYLPAGAAVAAVLVLGYMVARIRRGRSGFGVLDAVILTLVVSILGAAAIPLVEGASQQAKSSALLRNLHTLRSQIELYKLEHGGRSPVIFEGSFPQLIRATDAKGIPGTAGRDYPYGPYLHNGVPVNAVSGRSIITLTDAFPPSEPSGAKGWIYHQQTGQIAVDLPEFIEK
ncbi:MAG: type II secretion system protein [Candidatus Nealsonbacteria bacterium]|nr:type II secretion system protein [Candidatus Nealsonbacteria bacterium]